MLTKNVVSYDFLKIKFSYCDPEKKDMSGKYFFFNAF